MSEQEYLAAGFCLPESNFQAHSLILTAAWERSSLHKGGFLELWAGLQTSLHSAQEAVLHTATHRLESLSAILARTPERYLPKQQGLFHARPWP